MKTRECEACGKAFESKRENPRFCTKRCSARMRKPRPVQDIGLRFWTKVDVRGPDKCWPWTAAILKSGGYGAFMMPTKKLLRAHRVAWLLTKGEIPEGKSVLHRCDYAACCNPRHLKLGTEKDNTEDRMRRGRGRNQFGPWQSRLYR